ncbi:bifunctional glycosyltransferase 87/phosphatase PAP2 family protein [Streptomyces yaizuensis]|uniref:Phosphatase PAP2 family protein n=1 Tax=Streptomyces yaizuensis TaxID=2989713 RepID=A0ABQ5NU73_9ACTN|nr:bifunctional glycosyltransferase 87/phosphatase PAP2 family protein [Streptomyces sp. YSPA8]GLF93916.1 phosphatase PAP2 family protein [Streptomyces sp. YSPA8]
MARIALWLVAAVLAVRQTAVVLRQPVGERLLDMGNWVGVAGALHDEGSMYAEDRFKGDPFTGTPFAGLLLGPLTRSADPALHIPWTFGILLLVIAVGVLAARALPGPVSRRTAPLAAPVALILLLISLPVRNSFHLGQLSLLPVVLVLVGAFAVRSQRAAGVLIGIGAALQPTVLLFAPLLWFTGRRKAAVSTGLTFAAASALAWAALPRESWEYWVDHLAGTGLGGPSDGLANQSIHGMLLRFGLEGPLEIALYLLLAAAVAWLGLRRAVHYAKDGQLLLAVALTGCVAVAVSPATWQYQTLWVLLAVVGRVGTRQRDRMLWPFLTVAAITLPGKMLLPNILITGPIRENAVLLMAVAAACAVPFLSRTSPHFAKPVPTVYVTPEPSRWGRIPLLPFWRRVISRPNLLLELIAIRVGYSIYSKIRLMATAGADEAREHGRQINSIEQAIGIDIEHWFNHWVVGIDWLENFFNFYYTSFHFPVPLIILGLLYVRRPGDYRWARSALAFATVLALVGFWLYPLAPPRLMPGMGFVDTVHKTQDLSNPEFGAMTAVTNQYAAMPSLHFGWSLWCGVVVVMLAPKLWMKVLGLIHPAITLAVIVGTANHWILDAVGGATVVAAGFGLTYVLSGRRKVIVPKEAEAAGEATEAVGTGPVTAPAQATVLVPAARESGEGRGARQGADPGKEPGEPQEGTPVPAAPQ